MCRLSFQTCPQIEHFSMCRASIPVTFSRMAVTQQTQACVLEQIAGMDVNEIAALGTVKELKSMLRLYGKDEASIEAADDSEDVMATLGAMFVGARDAFDNEKTSLDARFELVHTKLMAEIVAMRQGSLKRKAFVMGASELQIDVCEDSKDVHAALMTLIKEELFEPFV